MIYVIDANNLAGKLGILGENNFDKALVGLVKNFFGHRNNKVFLVFDGVDFMGDKYSEGDITIIYTPKDNYYKNADDKIIELVKKFCSEIKEDLTIITDDLGIRKKTEETGNQLGKKIIIREAKEFAIRLERLSLKEDEQSEDLREKDLGGKEKKIINDELLKIWK